MREYAGGSSYSGEKLIAIDIVRPIGMSTTHAMAGTASLHYDSSIGAANGYVSYSNSTNPENPFQKIILKFEQTGSGGGYAYFMFIGFAV